MDTALIIFVKNPVEGKVKTRLAKSIGDEKAVVIYKQLLQHTYIITKEMGIDKYVYYGDYVNNNDIWDENYKKALQQGADLGQRMENAFKEVLSVGYNKVLIIGSDCAQLTTDIINTAIEKLDESDIVFGPSLDGGYYLLGMKKITSQLFNGIEWSTNTVFSKSLEIAGNQHLKVTTVQKLSDVDVIEDVPKNWLD